MKRFFSTYWGLFIPAGALIALDWWTKQLVRKHIPFGTSWLPEDWAWLQETFQIRLVHWENSGAAFGMFQGGSMVFTVLAFIVIGVIVYYFGFVEPEDWLLRLGLSMQLAGAAGNLISRLTTDGKVTDFIAVGAFPVFNVADASITVGTGILLLGVWLSEKREREISLEKQPEESRLETEVEG
ncbi:MAG: hypothetical protein Kow002_01440 [Anaerolineales bacterium]